MTLADVQYYCELSTIMALFNTDIDEHVYPNLEKWAYERVGAMSYLKDLDDKLKKTVAQIGVEQE